MVGEPGAADANELPAQVVTLRYPLTLPVAYPIRSVSRPAVRRCLVMTRGVE